MFKIGDKVKLIDINGRKERVIEEHIGFIESVTNDFIVIKLKNYKTCLNKSNLIEGVGLRLQGIKDNEWIEIGQEVFL